MFSSMSPRTVAVFICLIANLYLVANAAEEASLETPLSGLLGGDIDGLAQSDNFGSALAISADGNRIVVGARNHDASEQGTVNYYDIGSARVFEYGTSMNPTGWSQVGSAIDGVAHSDRFGSSVAISADGNRIIVGAPGRDVQREEANYYGGTYTNTYFDAGSVRVFEYGTSADPTGWSQVGSDIDGLAQSDRFGSAVAISADGNRIIVGAPNRDVMAEVVYDYGYYNYTYMTTLQDAGSVRVFEYGTAANPTGWSQVGGEIDGVAQYDYFGGAVALSSDGNSFVARTRENRFASMFKYGTPANLTGWAQAGDALSIYSNYYSMYSSEVPPFAASSDCKRIVVPTSFGVGVFEYGTPANLTGWSQVGTTITGGNNEEFGSAVTMSADGNHIVIGARRGDVLGSADNYFGTFNDVGFVRMMQYGSAASPTDWTQIGADVFGEAQNDLFGSSVALSGDAKRVAVGAPYNDPSVQDAGHVRVLATACVEDAYVSGGTCTSCAPGSTNEAGDVLTEVDTLCDVAYCAAYERVSNHTCVPCPAGTLNAPGDDPTGDDTGCDPLICGENYRVSSHGCLACETGDFNMAGDDASGEDTECDGFPSGWSDQGNYQGTNQPLVPSSDYSSATRSFCVGVAHFMVVALIVASFEVIDYAYRFCINIRCREP